MVRDVTTGIGTGTGTGTGATDGLPKGGEKKHVSQQLAREASSIGVVAAKVTGSGETAQIAANLPRGDFPPTGGRRRGSFRAIAKLARRLSRSPSPSIDEQQFQGSCRAIEIGFVEIGIMMEGELLDKEAITAKVGELKQKAVALAVDASPDQAAKLAELLQRYGDIHGDVLEEVVNGVMDCMIGRGDKAGFRAVVDFVKAEHGAGRPRFDLLERFQVGENGKRALSRSRELRTEFTQLYDQMLESTVGDIFTGQALALRQLRFEDVKYFAATDEKVGRAEEKLGRQSTHRGVVNFNQKMAAKVVEDILSGPTKEARGRIKERYIRMAMELDNRGDFTSCHYLIGALNNSAVRRLTETDGQVGEGYRNALGDLETKYSGVGSFKNLRPDMRRAMELAATTGRPFVPSGLVYSKDCTFIVDGNQPPDRPASLEFVTLTPAGKERLAGRYRLYQANEKQLCKTLSGDENKEERDLQLRNLISQMFEMPFGAGEYEINEEGRQALILHELACLDAEEWGETPPPKPENLKCFSLPDTVREQLFSIVGDMRGPEEIAGAFLEEHPGFEVSMDAETMPTELQDHERACFVANSNRDSLLGEQRAMITAAQQSVANVADRRRTDFEAGFPQQLRSEIELYDESLRIMPRGHAEDENLPAGGTGEVPPIR